MREPGRIQRTDEGRRQGQSPAPCCKCRCIDARTELEAFESGSDASAVFNATNAFTRAENCGGSEFMKHLTFYLNGKP